MSVISKVREINQRVAWGFIGVGLALIFGVLTVYQVFFQENRPALSIEILANTTVLDVKEELAELHIFYKGIDIRKTGQSLRVITMRIKNNGNEDILTSFYDSRDPFGILITAGKIIKDPEILTASNQYIRDYLNPKVDSERKVLFSDIILEEGQSFVIKLLLLHPNDTVPAIERYVGKIARVRNVAITEPFKGVSQKSFWERTFSGSPLVQGVRLVAYFLGIVLIIISIVVPLSLLSDAVERRKRHKIVRDYRLVTEVELSDGDDFLFEGYIKRGPTFILRVERLFGNDERRERVCQRLDEQKKELEERELEELARKHRELMTASMLIADNFVARVLIENGYIKKEDGNYLVDKHAEEVVCDFGKYLRKRKLIKFGDRFDHQSLAMIK